METTYKVKARCNKASGIDVKFKGIGDLETAMECAITLELAFPDVVVICEQTGEVVYNHYMSIDVFSPVTEMGRAIHKAESDMYL